MVIREVDYKDYHQIKKLVEKHKLKIYDQFSWEMIWKNNPFLKKNNIKWTPGWVIEESNSIVGHLGNIPVEYYYNLKPYLGSVISCWVVDEKYRFLSIKLLQKYNSEKNTDFSIGTTSNIKTAKALSVFGWKKNPMKDYNEKLYCILNLRSSIRAYLIKKNIKLNNFLITLISKIFGVIFFPKINYWKTFKTKKEFAVYEKFDDKFDIFWEKIKDHNKNTFMFNRNKDWINWHLNSQLKNNEAFILAEEENGKIKGYCICLSKHNKKTDLKKFILIDLIALDNNSKTLFNLLLKSINLAKEKNFHLFEIVGFNKEKRAIIKKIKPFSRKVSFCPFYFYSNKIELNKILENENSWDSTILDGDSIN